MDRSAGSSATGPVRRSATSRAVSGECEPKLPKVRPGSSRAVPRGGVKRTSAVRVCAGQRSKSLKGRLFPRREQSDGPASQDVPGSSVKAERLKLKERSKALRRGYDL